jgi:FixJ family two-component response regulator
MFDAVAAAIERARKRKDRQLAASAVRSAFDTLTLREKEVMALVTTGLMNKQIAAAVTLSEVTVKVHRGNIMRKMEARSLADLVRKADAPDLRPAPQRDA